MSRKPPTHQLNSKGRLFQSNCPLTPLFLRLVSTPSDVSERSPPLKDSASSLSPSETGQSSPSMFGRMFKAFSTKSISPQPSQSEQAPINQRNSAVFDFNEIGARKIDEVKDGRESEESFHSFASSKEELGSVEMENPMNRYCGEPI
jgi:hypothetical protein